MTIAIVDYGMGNLRSVAKALERVAPHQTIRITQNSADLRSAERVILPGQGAIGGCMRELARLELIDEVVYAARNKPFLGLCLGPQALLSFSEENGGTTALNILSGHVRRFPEDLRDENHQRLKIPHMGWNEVFQTQPHPLWRHIPNRSRFYFVHSYYLDPTDRHLIAGSCDYGLSFAVALAHENLFAVQFHPEKSAQMGLQLLANFADWHPVC